jgi:hypothetical protein
MAHTISYLSGAKPVGEESWQGSMSEAQALAQKVVNADEYDRVEIRDETGQLVYHYPRVFSKAP